MTNPWSRVIAPDLSINSNIFDWLLAVAGAP